MVGTTGMMRRIALVVLVLLGCIAESGRSVADLPTQKDPCGASARAEGRGSLDAILQYLRGALEPGGKMGRLYYQGGIPNCPTDIWGNVPFPKIEVASISTNAKGIAAIRDEFRNDPSVTVNAGPSRIPRITFGTVPDDILQTKISVIRFSPEEQFNPREAVWAMLEAKEVADAMRSRGYSIPSRLIDMLIQSPMKGCPRLPSAMTDVTLDQALDTVAETFNGIVIYGTRSQSREISADYVPLLEFSCPDLNSSTPTSPKPARR